MKRAAITLLLMIGGNASLYADTIDIDVTVRDFKAYWEVGGHPDFEQYLGSDPGIVETTLGADGKPVYNTATSNPTVTSKASFDQWYRDVSGVNLSTTKTLTLDNGSASPGGVYTFSSSSFFPIDGELYGDYAYGHNYHFTLEMHTAFTYVAGQTFSFTGDDDLWVFINDTLVIDLGGVHGPMSGSVSLDTLGLTLGETYDLDLFFAERRTTGSNFRIDTTIESLVSVPVPAPAPLGLLGLGLLALGRLRKSAARH